MKTVLFDLYVFVAPFHNDDKNIDTIISISAVDFEDAQEVCCLLCYFFHGCEEEISATEYATGVGNGMAR